MSCQWRFAFAPLDMILRRTKSWQYRDRDGNIQEKAKAKMYHHLNVKCINLKHPDYALAELCPICTSHNITQISLDLQSIAGNIHSIMTLTAARSIVISRFNVIATMYCLCSSIANYVCTLQHIKYRKLSDSHIIPLLDSSAGSYS